jgi:hypothetical protein
MRLFLDITVVIVLAILLGGAIPLALTGNEVMAQVAPEPEWDKTFGGSAEDFGYSVQQTSDGGFIVAGLTSSYGAGNYDFWLIKTDSAGNREWDKVFGGSAIDEALSVRQTSDGGYVVVGVTWSYGAGSGDAWLIKTDSSGNKQWDKTFGGSNYDVGNFVRETSDGGYIIAGITLSYGAGNADFWLIKTDSLGNKQWDKTFGGSAIDYGYSVQQTSDGEYIVSGHTFSYGAGDYDAWLIKTDSLGNKEWDKTFGGSAIDYGYSVQQTSDGGYIVGGGTESYGTSSIDVWLIKTDSLGNKEWDKTFGGSADDCSYSVQQTSDGGYIIAGTTRSYGAGIVDIWLIKTDSLGNKKWDKTFGAASSEEGWSVRQTSDGGYVVAGTTFSYGAGMGDVWLIKIGSETGGGVGTPSGGGGCFIATAAFGTPMAEEIQVLRDFRDSYMAGNPVGRSLVSLYYKTSPPIAQFIDEHPAVKPVVRAALMPAVAMSEVALSTTLAQKIAIVAGIALVCVALVVCLRRKAVKGGF